MASFKLNLNDDQSDKILRLQLRVLEIKAKQRLDGKSQPEESLSIWTDGRISINRLRGALFELHCDNEFVMASHSLELIADYIIVEFERNRQISKGMI